MSFSLVLLQDKHGLCVIFLLQVMVLTPPPSTPTFTMFYRWRKIKTIPSSLEGVALGFHGQSGKNRNNFLFNGSLSVGSNFTRSIFQEIDHWFLVKNLEDQEKAIDLEMKKRIIFGWKPPPATWLKCDIGSVWNKSRSECGAS